MKTTLTRRGVLLGAGGLAATMVSGTAALADSNDDPFPLPPFNYSKLPEAFRPGVVDYKTRQWPGTIIVDTSARQLYLVLEGGKAMRWGCAVGKDGFRWAGLADVARKVMWPRWTPPKDMIARSPEYGQMGKRHAGRSGKSARSTRLVSLSERQRHAVPYPWHYAAAFDRQERVVRAVSAW